MTDPAPQAPSTAPQTTGWNAEHYRQRHAFVFEASTDLVDGWLRPQPGEHILDLGCGTGELTARIAASGAQTLGIDSSPDMIAGAQAAFTAANGLSFAVVDAHALPYEAEFGAVFSNAALHWMKPLDRVLAGVAASLKPGGRLVLEMGGAGNVQATLDAVAQGADTLGLPTPAHPWVFPSTARLAGLLEGAGLRVERTHWFERPSTLRGPDGFREWLAGFGAAWLAPLSAPDRAALIAAAETAARPQLWNGQDWISDYCRLRAVAVKPA